MHHRLAGRCRAPWRALARAGACEQAQEGEGALAEAPAQFNPEDDQLAAAGAPQFWVRSQFAVDGLTEGESRFPIRLRAGLAVTPQRAYDRGVDRDLSTLPDRQVVGDDLDSAPVRGRKIEVEIAQGNIRGNPRSCLAANACCCAFEGASTRG